MGAMEIGHNSGRNSGNNSGNNSGHNVGRKARKKNPGLDLMQELLAAVRASHHEGHIA